MSIAFKAHGDQRRMIDLVKTILGFLIMPYTSNDNKKHLVMQVAAMEADQDVMNVNCSVETEPALRKTKITIEITRTTFDQSTTEYRQ